MRLDLLHRVPGVTLVTTLVLSVAGFHAESVKGTALFRSQNTASHAASGKPLPHALAAVVSEVKAKSRVPVLLPSQLPQPIRKATHAVVGKAKANGYVVSLFYRLGTGDAGFAALFPARVQPSYNPRHLPNVHKVKLARGIVGFFRPVSCGGSCAPANLWWEEGGVLYQIQLKLSPALSERNQKEAIVEVADSAILAGPR